jgi:hypothetical protein
MHTASIAVTIDRLFAISSQIACLTGLGLLSACHPAATASSAAAGSPMANATTAAPIANTSQPPPGKAVLMFEAKGAPLPGSVYWDGTATPASLAYRGDTKFKPTLTLQFAHPNGFYLGASYGDQGGTILPFNLPEGCDDGSGELKTGCYAQLAVVDFDQNSIPYIVVAFGDGLISLRVNVIRYHPPALPTDLSREQNFELVGSFDGQSEAIINPKKVILPIGSQGLGNEFAYVEGKFLDFNGAVATIAPAATAAAPAAQSRPAAQPVRVADSGDYPQRYARDINAQLMGGPICDRFKGMIMGYANQSNLPENVRVKMIDTVTHAAERNRCVR